MTGSDREREQCRDRKTDRERELDGHIDRETDKNRSENVYREMMILLLQPRERERQTDREKETDRQRKIRELIEK